MELKNIAILGGTGIVGHSIATALSAHPQFTVTVIQRPTSTPKPTRPISPSIRTLTSEQTLESLTTALAHQDALLCCLSGSALTVASQKIFVEAAIAAGVKLYFASEYVSDVLSPHFAVFPPQVVGEKIAIRQYLEGVGESGRIAWTAINSGPFFDMWLAKGPSGIDFAERKATIYGSGNNPSCWTPLPVTIQAVVNMLLRPDAILNRSILICGVRDVTQNALLAAVEAETGDKFALERLDVKAIRKDAFAALERGDLKVALRGMAINSNFNEEDSAANFWDKTENELVGVETVSVREAVKATMDAYGIH